jgi:hypothetical protein
MIIASSYPSQCEGMKPFSGRQPMLRIGGRVIAHGHSTRRYIESA